MKRFSLAFWLLILLSLASASVRASRWLWDNPLPTGAAPSAVWGAAPDDVFAVGRSGSILHYDGNSWSTMESGTNADLLDVWGSGRADVFVAGGRTLLHYNGSNWVQMPLNPTYYLEAIWGRGPTDVFAASGGSVLHFDGQTWTTLFTNQTMRLLHIWGTDTNDVFFVGSYGAILHYNGTTFEDQSYFTISDLLGVSGTSASNVYAVGGSEFLHYDGTRWTPVAALPPHQDSSFRWVWCGGTTVFAGGESGLLLHYDGSAWSNVSTTSATLVGAWGRSTHDVFAIGADQIFGYPVILHFDGVAWAEVTPSRGYSALTAVWGSSSADIFAAGKGSTLLHYDGLRWSSMASNANTDFASIWGADGQHVFAVGADVNTGSAAISFFTNGAWSSMPLSMYYQALRAIWGTASSNAFAVGLAGTILHYDGARWSPMFSGTTRALSALWGAGPTDIFAVGDAGTVLHFNGSSWSPMALDHYSGDLTGVWGAASNNVFAVGADGAILHYDGYHWAAMNSGTAGPLHGIWGSSASNVVAVGSPSIVFRYDGSEWTPVDINRYELSTVVGVWGTSPTNIVAVGAHHNASDSLLNDTASILHYDGTSWSWSTPGLFDLNGVWGSSASDVFAVGDSGLIEHFDGLAWAPMVSNTFGDLKAVWGSGPRDVYAAGYVPGVGGQLLHYDGAVWAKVNVGEHPFCCGAFWGVWASGAQDVFVVENLGNTLHYDGEAWNTLNAGAMLDSLHGIWGTGPRDVFAAGTYGILHYDGTSWSRVADLGGFFTGPAHLWGSDDTNVFVAPGVLHYDGVTWSTIPQESILYGVWGFGPSEVVGVGAAGAIVRYESGAWTTWVPSMTTLKLNGLWGTSAANLFAVGEKGTILHYAGDCVPGDRTLCLNGGRFETEATWRTPDGQSGVAHAVPLTGDTGYFWFFDSTNVELVVKALNGCGLGSPRFWVFAGGLTDVDVTLTARDSVTGQARTYHNPANTPFQAIQDTNAFATCDAPSGTEAKTRGETGVHAEDDVRGAKVDAPLEASSAARCIPTPTALCLNGGRFKVEATYRTAQGQSGNAQTVPLTQDTGYLWFFDASNVEAIVKVLDGCSVNRRYWVFSGGLTNVGVDLRVTDTSDGTVKTYTNPLGRKFAPIQDTRAFATCP